MPTRNELEKQNKTLKDQVILYSIIIIVCLAAILWLTIDNMMLQPNPNEPCFYDWDVSYPCRSEGLPLIAKTNDTGKYWICGDLYEVKAC